MAAACLLAFGTACSGSVFEDSESVVERARSEATEGLREELDELRERTSALVSEGGLAELTSRSASGGWFGTARVGSSDVDWQKSSDGILVNLADDGAELSADGVLFYRVPFTEFAGGAGTVTAGTCYRLTANEATVLFDDRDCPEEFTARLNNSDDGFLVLVSELIENADD
ncbi:MAG: hypothetical protein ABW245_11880 [Gaiellaceae bacterium]